MKYQPKHRLATAVILGLGLSLGASVANAVPLSADVIAVVDESGSMSGEHTWLGNMAPSLETGLTGAGVGTGTQANRYGLTGFGASGTGEAPHKHSVGGGDFGTAANFQTATGSLVTSGSQEDGWWGITYALNNYTFNPNAAVNIILATDEDRDNLNNSVTYNSVLNSLTSRNALLNAVVDCGFADATGTSALGIDSNGNAYVADGNGGFIKSTGGTQAGTCFGTTNSDYVNLALASGGAAWDLNLLRAGGLTATSFTNAFVDIKVQEIQQQPPTGVPEPATLALLGVGLVGMGVARAKRRS